MVQLLEKEGGMQRLKILAERDVRKLITMEQAIHCVRDAYVQLSQGKAHLPPRTSISVNSSSSVLFMPAYLAGSCALGAKIVSVFPGNPEKKLPRLHALIVMLRADTGQPELVMDGTYLTALRTGAASGVATRLLARKDACVAALIGAGVQGRTQLEAVCTVRPVEKVWVYDRDRKNAARFVEEMNTHGDPIPRALFVAESPARAVGDADIICTATSSSTPVFEDGNLKPGVHINSVGSFTPEMQEIPSRTVARAKIVVSLRSAALSEAGDLLIPLKEGLITEQCIHGEIGEILTEKIPGRESDEEITFFKSVGLAIQDMAVASFVRNAAMGKEIGTTVEL
jgi:alanine dehydrogenase